MIHVQYRRIGPIVVAMTVDDNHDIKTALGLTENHALRRLVR